MCLIGCGRLAGRCGKMYSCHLFSYGGSLVYFLSWSSGRLQENLKLLALRVVAVAYERWSLTRGSKHRSDLTGKRWYFGKQVAEERWSQPGGSTVVQLLIIANLALRASLAIYHLHIYTRAHEITVNYIPVKLFGAKVWPLAYAEPFTWSRSLGSSRNRAWMTISSAGQDGWILAKFFFFFACLWTETESRSISSPKKERGQYRVILTEQAWSIKESVMWLAGNFFLRDTAGRPRAGKMAPSCQLAAQDLVRLAHSLSQPWDNR